MSHKVNMLYLEQKLEDFEGARAEGNETKTERVLIELRSNGFEREALSLASLI